MSLVLGHFGVESKTSRVRRNLTLPPTPCRGRRRPRCQGVAKIAKWATGAMFLNYAHAVATALLSPAGAYRAWIMAPAHALLAAWLARSYRRLDPESSLSVKRYYKSIWDLFYLEYAMYPFI